METLPLEKAKWYTTITKRLTSIGRHALYYAFPKFLFI